MEGRTPDRYITLTAGRVLRNKSYRYMIALSEFKNQT